MLRFSIQVEGYLEYLLIILILPLIYLIVVLFFPGFEFAPEDFRLVGSGSTPADSLPYREDIEFLVDNKKIRGWFYRAPKSSAPCVVMATGLGGTRRMGLEEFAIFYRNQGFHCLTFDYRHFGDSEGQPRALVAPLLQLEDLRQALRWLGARQEVDGVFLWGASAAGAYGLILAAEQGGMPLADSQSATVESWPLIHGVVCQVPALDLRAEFKGMINRMGFLQFLRTFIHAQRDRGRGRLGLSPHYIPMVGESVAILNGPGAREGFQSICSGVIANRICARSLIMPPPMAPYKGTTFVRCPVLIQLAAHDSLIDPNGHQKIAARLGHLCELRTYEGGHFDLYRPPLSEAVLLDQIGFFKRTRR